MRQLRAFGDPSHAVVGHVFSDNVTHRVLAANTAEDLTVPTGAKTVMLSASADAYLSSDGTAAVPSADVTDGSGAAYLGAGKTRHFVVEDVTAISVVSAGTCIVTAEWFA